MPPLVKNLIAIAGIGIAVGLGGDQISNYLSAKRQRGINARINEARRLTREPDDTDDIMRCQRSALKMVLEHVERNIADGENSFVSGATGGYRGGGGCRTKIEIITYPDLNSMPVPAPR